MNQKQKAHELQEISKSILKSLDGGFIYAYFCNDYTNAIINHEKANEKWLRTKFKEIIKKGDASSLKAIRKLNAYYKTRCPGSICGMICDSISNVKEELFSITVSILENQKYLENEQIKKIINNLFLNRYNYMDKNQNERHYKPYSLMTKICHFISPKTFPIYDGQACKSWETVCTGCSDIFEEDDLLKPDFLDYKKIMKFYELFWNNLPQRQEIYKESKRVAETFDFDFEKEIGILSILDKFFWIANGNEKIIFSYSLPLNLS